MIDLVLYLVIFASAVVVLQTIHVLDKQNWHTNHAVRGAFLGLICSSWWTFLSCLYNRAVTPEPLVAVLIAVSILFVVDRRGQWPL